MTTSCSHPYKGSSSNFRGSGYQESALAYAAGDMSGATFWTGERWNWKFGHSLFTELFANLVEIPFQPRDHAATVAT